MPGSVTVTSTGVPSAGSAGIRNGDTAEPGSVLLPSGPTSYSLANSTAPSWAGGAAPGTAEIRIFAVLAPAISSCEDSGRLANRAAWPGMSIATRLTSRDELPMIAPSPGMLLIEAGLPPGGLMIVCSGP